MITAGRTAPWDSVRDSDNLLHDDWQELLDRANGLYQHFRHADSGGLGPTRTHKLLHLKRPHVFPIVDSVVRNVYLDQAKKEGGGRQAVYWPVLAREIRANADGYRALASELKDDRVGRLTIPRLHDILVWSLNGPQRDAAQAEISAHD